MQPWMIEALRRQRQLRNERRRNQETRDRSLHASPPDRSWQRPENMPGANERPKSITTRGVWHLDLG